MQRHLLLILALAATAACDETPMEVEEIPTEALVAYLPFTADVTDAGPEGNDGVLLGGATASGELILGSNDTDALALPGSTLDVALSFTISAFVRLDDLHGGDHHLFSAANNLQDDEVGIWYREATDEWIFGFDGDEDASVVNAAIEDGGWHHIAIVRSTSIAVFYLNGLQIGTPQVVSDVALVIENDGLIFGQDQDSVGGDFDATEAWAGAIDNLRIYERPLDAMEIALLAAEPR